MKYKFPAIILFAVAFVGMARPGAAQQPQAQPDKVIDAATRNAVIDTLLKELNELYVFPDSRAIKEIYSSDELKHDFSVFRASLEEGHPALYRYRSKKEMDSIFDTALASLTKEMSDREFMILLCRVVANIGDGHLRVVPPKARLDKLDEGPTALPFQPYWSDGKLFVKRNYSALSDKDFQGAQIVSINGHSIENFIKEYLATIPSDGINVTHKYRSLERSRLLVRAFYILYGYTESYEVEYVSQNESANKKSKLPGLVFDKLIEIANNRYPANGGPAEFTFSLQDRSGYLRITSFDKETLKDGNIDFPKFLKSTFTSLAENRIQNLILDVRSNGGGTDEYGKLLFSYFVDKPFDYYESLRMNKETYDFFKYTNRPGMKAPSGMLKPNAGGTFDNVQHPNVGKQSPSLPTFNGNLFVLINGGSFSTTSEFLSLLDFHTKVTFIGEESGGGYYGNSSGPTPDLTLPNTKVRVEIPLMKYSMAVSGYQYSDRGLIPDQTVVPTILDKLTKKDPEREFANGLIKKLPSQKP